jgi:signal transduction histidine kinase/CheY-like chemotaxis protein
MSSIPNSSIDIDRVREFNEAAVGIYAVEEPEAVARYLATTASRLLGFGRSAVWLATGRGGKLKLAALYGVEQKTDDFNFKDVSAAGPYVASLLANHQPEMVTAGDLPAYFICALRLSPENPVLVAPLRVAKDSPGILLLAEPASDVAFTEAQSLLVTSLALHAAAALRSLHSPGNGNSRLLDIVARGKQEWEQTFDAIADGIYITNTDHVITRANTAFAALLEKHPRDIVGKTCPEVVWGSDAPCQGCKTIKKLTPGEASAFLSREYELRGMNCLLTTYPVTDEAGGVTSVVHIVKDNTEQKRLQDLVIRTEKLRAIGEMAAGIAHDFNNLLSSILGWSDLMMLGGTPERLRDCAVAIHQAAVDGTETVKRIQEYTRMGDATEQGPINLNEIALGAIELARPRLQERMQKQNIDINIKAETVDIPAVRANASDLREVLLNMIFNAIDAMPRGGDIIVRTGQDGDRTFISISDTGVGMPEAIRERVFDPFFTTKGSAGSGMGLSVAYGIIARHGGEITVSSKPSAGSTFTIFLPASREEDTPNDEEPVEPPAPRKIILVDDDRRVLNAIRALLVSDRHTVSAFSNGKDALAALATGDYDMIITDLGMPDMNGWEVAARAKEIAPHTPILLLTGWSDDLPPDRLKELGFAAILNKPCRLSQLRRTIASVANDHVSELKTPEGEKQQNEVGLKLDPNALRILVVEDNRLLADSLRELLAVDGHIVTLARSTQEGIKMAKEGTFDLVLSDLRMPDGAGTDISAALPSSKRPLMVIMTGDVNAEQLVGKGLGVDMLLHKPWTASEWQWVEAAARRWRTAKG